MESYLVQDSFLKDFEKVPGYKASFEFKNKMFASMRSQRTSLVPLYKLADAVTRVKMQVDDTLDSSGAIVIPDDCFLLRLTYQQRMMSYSLMIWS